MFGRKLNTGDARNDAHFDGSHCFHFLFPVSGGPLGPNGNIGKHSSTPHVSSEKFCLGPCSTSGRDHPVKPVAQPQPHGRWTRQVRQWWEQLPNPEKLAPFNGPARVQPAPEPEPEPFEKSGSASEPEPHPEGESSSSDRLHPMDCADIVIGSVDGNAWRVFDYYTVSRATPRRDEFYSGEQSITESIGFERDGITTIMFRRNLDSSDPADHSIVPGPMTLIWAHGQELGSYSHRPESALETSSFTVRDFYEPHVPRYHGSNNRGSITLNFFE